MWVLMLLLLACEKEATSKDDTAQSGDDDDADTDPRDTNDDDDTDVGDTWETFAADFFETYCVECHDTQPKDFRDVDDVAAFAERIRCGTAPAQQPGCTGPPPRQFPVGPGPYPSDEERTRLVEWIDAGMP